METVYQEIKSSLLDFGKEHSACQPEYKRLYAAESIEEVMAVVKDNFEWCCQYKDFANVLLAHREQFAQHKIWINTSIEVREGVGYLLATEGEYYAESWDTSTINATSWETSTIHATSWETSTIHATSRETSTIHATSWDTSTIYATSCGTSTINAESRGTSTINAESCGTSTIYAESWDTSTVILLTANIECQVNDSSIARYIPENRIVFVDNSMKFEQE